MYLLLVALGVIILIHSLLIVLIMQKNTDLTNKIDQLRRKNESSKYGIGRQALPEKELKRPDRSLNQRKNKPMKRGSR